MFGKADRGTITDNNNRNNNNKTKQSNPTKSIEKEKIRRQTAGTPVHSLGSTPSEVLAFTEKQVLDQSKE